MYYCLNFLACSLAFVAGHFSYAGEVPTSIVLMMLAGGLVGRIGRMADLGATVKRLEIKNDGSCRVS